MGKASKRLFSMLERIETRLDVIEEQVSMNLTRQPLISAHIYGLQRNRDAYFASGYFGDPAWDILLTLHIAQTTGKKITTADIAKNIGAPEKITRRYLTALQDDGLVQWGNDETKRSSLIKLTNPAIDKLNAIFDEFQKGLIEKRGR